MSDSGKCFNRPKVRFSKSAESPEQMSDFGAFKKPKITSVTTLRPQIKILKAPLANKDFGWNSSPEEISTRRSAGDSLDDECFRLSKTKFISSPDLEEILPYPENAGSKNEVASEPKSSQKSLSSVNQPSKTLKSILIEKKPSSAKPVHSSIKKSPKSVASLPEKVSKFSKDSEKIGTNTSQPKSFGSDKENVPSSRSSKTVTVKVPHNTPRTGSSAGTAKSTVTQNSRSSINENSSKAYIAKKPVQPVTKTSTELKRASKPCTKVEGKIGEKTAVKKSSDAQKKPPVTLMACMKSGKIGNKKAPMKKTIVRDTSAKRSEIYIGPGFPRSRTPDLLPRSKGENNCRSRADIHSADKLARPEYNSITCTMRQLREARKEKIVPDVDHLPAFYRRLINGKVSSALDFGANEAIYRDLIDLSIDEKQLPTRLTRSKDPEPRQRDITPKLSDFFVPTNEDEFRRAVLPRPPSPRVLDTWNPYKISDRIFSWKENLDREF